MSDTPSRHEPAPDTPAPDPTGRVLVFIVSYNAQQHIRSVFDRIPAKLINDPQVDFLCIDDASRDDGARILHDWARKHAANNFRVMRNPVNQGYGGNQKLGYRAAIDGGYDFVILLHGDGQYAPELLPEFIRSWRETRADVVLGSRMHDIRSARRGGMPWHKVVANRALTWIQNRLTGLRLSEYHTGYRGYATAFLRRAPFEVNTNHFHFDTHILLQAAHVGAKIVEIPIPTHYGDEVCHVPLFRYGWNVLASTLQYKLHRMGMLCSLRYRNLEPIRYRDKTESLYSSHELALRIVERERPAKLLDIGCGPGFVARRCEALGARVTGVDVAPPLPGMMSEFHACNLEREPLPVEPKTFDAILMLDVIEHLADPENFLLSLRNRDALEGSAGESSPTVGGFSPDALRGPLLILSTPNIAFAAVRLNLLLGRFNYAERGILDITHKRLFTRKSLRTLLEDCGYQIERFRGVGVPFATVMGGRLGRLLSAVSAGLAWLWPSMFSFQFMVECRPLPGARSLLASAQRLDEVEAPSV